MDTYLDNYTLHKLKCEEIENLNIPITREEIQSVIKNLPRNMIPGPEVFPQEFYQTFKAELIPILFQLLNKWKKSFRTLSMKLALPWFQTQRPH